MKKYLEYIAQQKNKSGGVAIVIGAGIGSELPQLRNGQFSRIVLVEAHPHQAQTLVNKIRPTQGEESWSLAITASKQEHAVLHATLNPRDSSVYLPTGLLDYFPSNTVQESIPVAACAIDEAIEQLRLNESDQNLLILDAPGQSLELLSILSSEALQQFEWIIVRSSAEALYASSVDAADNKQLNDFGFRAVALVGNDTLPYTSVLFVRDESVVQQYKTIQKRTKLLILQAELAAAHTANQSLQAAHESLQAELQTLVSARDAKITALQTEMQVIQTQQAEHAAAEAGYQALQAEHEKVKAAMLALQTAHDAKINALQQELKAKQVELEKSSALAALIATRDADIVALKAAQQQLNTESANANAVAIEQLAIRDANIAALQIEKQTLMGERETDRRFFAETLAARDVANAAQQASHQSQISDAMLEEIIKSIKAEKVALSNTLSWKMNNLSKQFGCALSVQHYFQTKEMLPEYYGWTIAADLAVYLIKLLNFNDYDLIVEFGSGSSTSLIAKIIHEKKLVSGITTDILSFDHLEKYYDQTKMDLRNLNLESDVDLVLAPLKPFANPSGDYQYYDCQKTLHKYRSKNYQRILVLVDGPPGATCDNARYPALPVLLANFPSAHIDFLLDDFVRAEEKRIADLWYVDLKKLELAHTSTNIELEKGLLLLTVQQ